MIYRKQNGYDTFHCIADKCPKSCCEGWQIMIDDDSLRKYQNHTGAFAERLQTGINRQEQCFRQNRMRCHMLSATGLCDLQSTLGEAYLCDTCRQYPRHIEEFLDLREYSLSLSCPEAVRMLLDPEFQFTFSASEDGEVDDPEEFDDFDLFLFDKLTYAREQMLRIAGDHAHTLSERMEIITSAALQLQDMYDQGDVFAMDDISYNTLPEDSLQSGCSPRYMMESLDLLLDLEVLESSWTDILQKVKAYWSNQYAHDSGICQQPVYSEEYSAMMEKVLQSLLFTYVCGSIYDGQIYARTMIAVMSTRWIMMIHAAIPHMSLMETIYLFSREVEHSDLNINTLISAFEAEL